MKKPMHRAANARHAAFRSTAAACMLLAVGVVEPSDADALGADALDADALGADERGTDVSVNGVSDSGENFLFLGTVTS